ncbi:MAG: FtsB family cell division protein [bacterium]
MVGKAAVAVSIPLEAEERFVTNRRVIKRRVKRRVGTHTAYGFFVATAVALVLLYVAQYAYVAQINLRIARAEQELARAITVQQQLEQRAGALKSLERIEREATTRLGMCKPEEVRVVTAALPTVPTAEEAQVPPAGSVPEGPRDKVTALLNWALGLRKALAQGLTEVQ